jgi:hypothetical protein
MDNKVITTSEHVTHFGKWELDKEKELSIDCYVTTEERRVLSRLQPNNAQVIQL